MAKAKNPVKVVTKTEVKGVNPVVIDFTKPGFSNVAPDSPQAKAVKRSEVLPSQINK